MNRVVLPYTEPMYSTYHWLSNAGIPAKGNKTSDIWYYNNTVNWYCKDMSLTKESSPDIKLTTGGIWNIPFLCKTAIDVYFIRHYLIEVIKTILEDGYYLAFNDADDYYIEGKTWYHDKHVFHDGMLVGYDDDKGIFLVAAYDYRWQFRVFETPQQCFYDAMTIHGTEKIYGKLYAVKAKKDEQQLDIPLIYNSIEEYLASEKVEPKKADYVYGIAVYDSIGQYLEYIRQGDIPFTEADQRVFRLIWEHKKCMYGRIQEVETALGLKNSISSEYETIVKAADNLRYIFMKIFMTAYSEKHINRMKDVLSEMKDKEGELLKGFMAQMRMKSVSSQF